MNKWLCGAGAAVMNLLSVGCQVIGANQQFVFPDVVRELAVRQRDYSLETVKMFYDDAVSAGFTLNGYQKITE